MHHVRFAGSLASIALVSTLGCTTIVGGQSTSTGGTSAGGSGPGGSGTGGSGATSGTGGSGASTGGAGGSTATTASGGSGGASGTTSTSSSTSSSTSTTTTSASSSTNTCPAPAGGTGATWADCATGLDPTQAGGALLWATAAPVPCLLGPWWTPPLTSTGPTADIAVGVNCALASGGSTAAYSLLDGGGRPIFSSSFPMHSGWVDLVLGPHDELATSWSGGWTTYQTSSLSVGGAHGFTWTSYVTGQPLSSVSFSTPRIDAAGNTFSRAQTQAAVKLDAALSLPSAGAYLLRGGTAGEAMLANPPALFAPDDTGGVFFFGALTGTMDFGCGPLVPSAPGAGYIARLDASWACVWSDVLPVTPAVLSDGAGGVVLSATSGAALDLGCGAHPAAAGGSTFVARLDGAGACVFGAALGAPGLTVARDAADGLVVSGLALDGVDLGGGALSPIGERDAVVGAIDATGTPLWSRRFGAPGVFMDAVTAVPAAGHLALLLAYGGAVDFGGGPVTAPASGPVVVSLDGTGAHRWSRAFPIQGSHAARLDACGALVVTSIDPQFDVGCGPVIPDNAPTGGPPPPGYGPPAMGVARFQP